MLCRIADFTVEIRHQYPYLPRLCRDYLVEEGAPDFTLEATNEEIAAQMQKSPDEITPGYAESLCVYRRLCDTLALHGVALMHGAVIATEGCAYIFTAPSGTGKTTHLALWKRMLGEGCFILNGDKPLLRVNEAGEVLAYGTPWCGKEGWNRNTALPVRGLCFLERGAENRILPVSGEEGAIALFSQMLKPSGARGIDRVLGVLSHLAETVPMYRLYCNISLEAAALSYRTMHAAGRKETEE